MVMQDPERLAITLVSSLKNYRGIGPKWTDYYTLAESEEADGVEVHEVQVSLVRNGTNYTLVVLRDELDGAPQMYSTGPCGGIQDVVALLEQVQREIQEQEEDKSAKSLDLTDIEDLVDTMLAEMAAAASDGEISWTGEYALIQDPDLRRGDAFVALSKRDEEWGGPGYFGVRITDWIDSPGDAGPEVFLGYTGGADRAELVECLKRCQLEVAGIHQRTAMERAVA